MSKNSRVLTGLPLSTTLTVCLLVGACSGRPPELLRRAADLAQQVNDKRNASLSGFVGDMRLTYFGSQGRIKGKATFAVQRPASIRYEVIGPHGGAVQAFACNGTRLYFLDIGAQRFVDAPATAANMDALIGLAKLNLAADEWVDLFLGGVRIPAAAEVEWLADDGLFRFTAAHPGMPGSDLAIDVNIDLDVVRVVTRRSGLTVSELRIRGYDRHRIPTAMEIRFNTGADTTPASAPTAKGRVRLRLENVAVNPQLDADVFVLQAPDGVVPERY